MSIKIQISDKDFYFKNTHLTPQSLKGEASPHFLDCARVAPPSGGRGVRDGFAGFYINFMKRHYLYLLLILVSACAGSKTQQYEKRMAGAPAWVTRSPDTPGYYHGVGTASKTSTTADYREVARQNALADLAAGISVNISATSVLSQYEFDKNYSEYYRTNILISSAEQLEGYERVDSWENAQQYWVYYRLSIGKYNEIKKGRIDKALTEATANFKRARQMNDQNQSADALRFYIKSLENIKDFLGETLTTEIDGRQQEFSGLLISEMLDKIKSIRIAYPVGKLNVTRGNTATIDQLQVLVINTQNQPLQGIPILIKYSYAPGRITEKTSDAEGSIRLKLDPFDSKKKEEMISSTLDITKILKDNTQEVLIRRLLQSITLPEYILPVEIQSPVFFVNTTEKNLGNSLSQNIIKQELETLLRADGFTIAPAPAAADLLLTVAADTREGSAANGKFNAPLSATFDLTDKRGILVYNATSDDVTGLGSSYVLAGEDAYRSLVGKIRINYYPAMFQTIFSPRR